MDFTSKVKSIIKFELYTLKRFNNFKWILYIVILRFLDFGESEHVHLKPIWPNVFVVVTAFYLCRADKSRALGPFQPRLCCSLLSLGERRETWKTEGRHQKMVIIWSKFSHKDFKGCLINVRWPVNVNKKTSLHFLPLELRRSVCICSCWLCFLPAVLCVCVCVCVCIYKNVCCERCCRGA